MAVHSHVYRPYEGVRTSLHTRWLVVARYALRDALARKLTLVILVLAAFPLLASAALIYLHHNLEAVTILPAEMVQGITNALPINPKFFYWLLTIEGYAAFLLTAVIGPRILVNDFRDNGLPLYLSRPLTRVDYLLGKAAAIVTITSLVTWVPLLLLVGLQSTLEKGWLLANWWVVPAIVIGAWSAIALFALASLAVAAVLRRRAMAEAAFVAMFLVVPLVALVVDQFLHARWAVRFFLPAIYEALWTPLFDLQQSNGLSPLGALTSLVIALVLATVVLLRRVRAWEIVR